MAFRIGYRSWTCPFLGRERTSFYLFSSGARIDLTIHFTSSIRPSPCPSEMAYRLFEHPLGEHLVVRIKGNQKGLHKIVADGARKDNSRGHDHFFPVSILIFNKICFGLFYVCSVELIGGLCTRRVQGWDWKGFPVGVGSFGCIQIGVLDTGLESPGGVLQFFDSDMKIYLAVDK